MTSEERIQTFKEPIGRAVDEIDILRAVLKPCLDNSDDLPVRLAFGVDSILAAMRQRLEAVREHIVDETEPKARSTED
jgi:hypothetical protein